MQVKTLSIGTFIQYETPPFNLGTVLNTRAGNKRTVLSHIILRNYHLKTELGI